VPAPDWFAELLNRELSAWVRLSGLQIEQLFGHYELLLKWNQRMNLTTVTPGSETVIRHYCESLFFAAHIPESEGSISVLDLGSGAGFPGFPMAVLKPAWSVSLVESNQRKAVFLRESTRGVSNVSVIASRMESISVLSDWVVARAVDPTQVLSKVPRLASKIGLMLGVDDFSLVQPESRVAWAKPIRLPWGDRRLCVYGGFHVERDYS
jgi:16S rRNA (guanine(527)-N(7))-methyltransferase RsmG